MGVVFSCRTMYAHDLTLKIAEKVMGMLTSSVVLETLA